jgi:hypothetical protein
MRLQVVITDDQEDTLNAQAAAISSALKKPVTVPDLIRMWIDGGCYLMLPGPEAGTVLDEKHGITASGAPVEHSIMKTPKADPTPFEPFKPAIETPAAAKEAADLAAARAGRQPILKPGEKKKP